MENNQNISDQNTATLVTALALIFVYPVGLIVMWFWPKWKKWVKLLITAPAFLILGLIILPVVFVMVNPSAQMEKSEEAKEWNQQKVYDECLAQCVQNGGLEVECANSCGQEQSE